MKNRTTIAVAMVISLVMMTSVAMSGIPEYSVNWNKAEQNYIYSLENGNIGVRQSAAKYLAAYRLKGSVEHLIEVLQQDPVERVRMAAAYALIHIGDRDGLEAVYTASLKDGSAKVSRFCESLLKEYDINMKELTVN